MDLFKLLGGGAKFDRRRFKEDFDAFRGKKEPETVHPDNDALLGEIDFFNTQQAPKASSVPAKTAHTAENDSQPESPGTSYNLMDPQQLAKFRKDHRIRVYGSDIPNPVPSFDSLEGQELLPFVRKNLLDSKFVRPTGIQMQAVPIILQNRDVMACAPTGSGKTMAYLLPIIQHLKAPEKVGYRAVIIAPTRELAKQIYQETKRLCTGRKFKVCVLTKATAATQAQDPQLRQKFDILISTPLRLVHAIQQENIELKNVHHLVLDEADKLMELGFLDQTDEIFAACSHPKLQKLMFSATIPAGIEALAKTVMHDPIRVVIGAKNAATETIKQKLVYVGAEDGKLVAIRQLIQEGLKPPVLIFVQSIERAKELFHELVYDGINVDVIHSERTQAQRDAIVEGFRLGRIWVLISTELMARGLDFKGVNLVINYDFPQTVQSYIHRIGRTGRAGRSGEAVTYFTKDDVQYLKSIVNVMRESGCDVPEWMLSLKKPSKTAKKNLRKKPIERDEITTMSLYDKKRLAHKRQITMVSKKKKLKALGAQRGYATVSIPSKAAAGQTNEDTEAQETTAQPADTLQVEDAASPESEVTTVAEALNALQDTQEDVYKHLERVDVYRMERYFSNLQSESERLESEKLPWLKVPVEVEETISHILRQDWQIYADVDLIPGRFASDSDKRATLSKLDLVHLTLEKFGFRIEDIREAMSVTRCTNVDGVLDWLCAFVPEDRLPTQFSDAYYLSNLGLKVTQVTSAMNKPTVSELLPETGGPAFEMDKAFVVPDDDSWTNNATDDKDVKAWILQSCTRFEDDSDDDFEQTNRRYAQNKIQIYRLQQLQASKTDESDMAALKKEIKRLNDVNKSMEGRWEYDKKAAESLFKAALAIYKQELVARERAERIAAKSKFQEQEQLVSGEEDDDFDPLSVLDEEPAQAQLTRKPEYSVHVYNAVLPKSWTGKSPKAILIDYCRRQDVSNSIKFERIDLNDPYVRCRVNITIKNETFEFEMAATEGCRTIKEAEELVSTRALYKIAAGPIYLIIPPNFREIWSRWQKEEEDQAHAEQKQRRIDRFQFLSGLIDTTREKISASVNEGDQMHGLDQLAARDIPQKRRNADAAALKATFTKRRASKEQATIQMERSKLPISDYSQTINHFLAKNQVLVICGATGCGKSTQVPQFLAEQMIFADKGPQCNILCTEPRRISAISLAQRVSVEMGDSPHSLGRPGSMVGYQIRMESKTSPDNVVQYCTTGILLRRLETDRDLKTVTHVIVDEVHERTIDSDFLLFILRRLMTRRPDLRIILMSATVDAARFSSYFYDCPILQVPGRTFPIQEFFLEDIVQDTNYVLEEDSEYATRVHRKRQGVGSVQISGKGGNSHLMRLEWFDDEVEENINDSFTDLDPNTAVTLRRMDHGKINYELIFILLERLCSGDYEGQGKTGAILIFLPGINEIRHLYNMLISTKEFSDPNKTIIYPLHSVLSSSEQESVFFIPPEGVRKIVIATNIAETGITIPDVTVVIDSGKAKQMSFDRQKQISSLSETFIAKANANQRRGRAGRVQPGVCFHLFTKERFQKMQEHETPEMLRLSLEQLCLRVKLAKTGGIRETLTQVIEPPPGKAIDNAIHSLIDVQALVHEDDEDILTPLGGHLARLPVEVHIGKLILYGAFFKCLDAALTIAAFLSHKSPFVRPFGKESESDTSRNQFASENSDFQMVYKAYCAWRTVMREDKSSAKYKAIRFADKNFLSHQTLLTMEDMKAQFLFYLQAAGLIILSSSSARESRKSAMCSVPERYDTHSNDPTVVSAALTAALYPRIAVASEGNWTALQTNGAISIHPASINYPLSFADYPSRYMIYYTIIQSTKVYVWETSFVDAVHVLLFGPACELKHALGTVMVDKMLKFRCNAKAGSLVRLLRSCMNMALRIKTDMPDQDLPPKINTYIDLAIQLMKHLKPALK